MDVSRLSFQNLKGTYKKEGEGLSTRACRDRKRGHFFKLEDSKFRLDIRMKFFAIKVCIKVKKNPQV